jgi:hypothetical protein
MYLYVQNHKCAWSTVVMGLWIHCRQNGILRRMKTWRIESLICRKLVKCKGLLAGSSSDDIHYGPIIAFDWVQDVMSKKR